jgi:hypothetical protein
MWPVSGGMMFSAALVTSVNEYSFTPTSQVFIATEA